jgi:GxxExxY protein
LATKPRYEAFEPPVAQYPLRTDVGTQAEFRKTKPLVAYRYDSSLAPVLDWDGENPTLEQGEALIAQIEELSRGFTRIDADHATTCAKAVIDARPFPPLLKIRKTRMSISGGRLKHEKLTGAILEIFFQVYNELGAGFLESVYEKAMEIALRAAGYRVERQVPVLVWFRGQQVGDFDADLLVEGLVLLELKSARAIDPAFEAQLINYLRATDVEVGLLLNFGPKPEYRRLAYDNSRKLRPGSSTPPE